VHIIGRTGLGMFLVMAACVVMPVHVVVPVVVSVIMLMRVLTRRILPVDPGFALAASANRAHRSISALAPGELPTRPATAARFPYPENRTGSDEGTRLREPSRAIAGCRFRNFVDTARTTRPEPR
jgi:hypothetical protein